MKRPTTQQLQTLMEAALVNRYAEPMFFRALLEATVHVFVRTPPADTAKLEVIKVCHPDDNAWVVPFFTSAAKAEANALGQWSVAGLPGRHFLELTRGCTLVVNPGATGVLLHPIEVEALLAGQSMGAFVTGQFAPSDSITFSAPPRVALVLLDRLLANHWVSEPAIEAAYVAEMCVGADRADVALLLEIIATEERAISLIQTIASFIEPFVASFPIPIRLACRRRDHALLAEHSEARQLYPRPSANHTESRQRP